MLTNWRVFTSRLSSIRLRAQDRAEFDDEYEFHVEMAAEEFQRAGHPAPEAIRRARLELGHRESLHAELRQQQSLLTIETLLDDCRRGLLNLSRNRASAAASMLPVVASILFLLFLTQANHELRHPSSPYPNADRLATVWRDKPGVLFSTSEIDRLRPAGSPFEALAHYDVQPRNYSFGAGVRSEPVWGLRVSPHVFEILGVPPWAGRTLRGEDVPRTVVLSYDLWRRHHSGTYKDGLLFPIDGETYTIVGVMPPNFRFDPPVGRVEMWVPIAPQNAYSGTNYRTLAGIGRLRSGIDFEDARRILPIARLLSAGDSQLARSLEIAVFAAWALLIISLMSAGGLGYAREALGDIQMALLRALGASRTRLATQLAVESTIYVGTAAAVGWAVWRAFGWFTAGQAISLFGADSRTSAPPFDGAWLILLPVALCGPLVIAGIRVAGFCSASGTDLRAGLLVCALAPAIPLVAAAITHIEALTRTVVNGAAMKSSDVYTARVIAGKISDPATFCESATQRIRESPGVVSVSAVNVVPNRGTDFRWSYRVAEGNPWRDAVFTVTCPGLFDVLGMQIVAGRDFRSSDDHSGRAVVIVNEALVRASGAAKQLILAGGEVAEVIGAVRDTTARTDVLEMPQIYRPYSQFNWRAMTLLVRTDGSPFSGESLRRVVDGGRSPQALPPIVRMEEITERSLRPLRIRSVLLGGLGALTLIVLTTSIAGVAQLVMRERRREIGIRFALGAGVFNVAKPILARFRFWGGGALAAGAALAWLASGAVAAIGPGSTIAATALLAAIVVCAIVFPAWRTARSEIAAALRTE